MDPSFVPAPPRATTVAAAAATPSPRLPAFAVSAPGVPRAGGRLRRGAAGAHGGDSCGDGSAVLPAASGRGLWGRPVSRAARTYPGAGGRAVGGGGRNAIRAPSASLNAGTTPPSPTTTPTAGLASPSSSPPDVLVLGGGVIGLATALELARAGAAVTVLSPAAAASATAASAGMLAPQSERLPPGPLRDLAIASLRLYPGWAAGVAAAAGVADVGYRADGHFLAPVAAAGDAVDLWVPPTEAVGGLRPQTWLDADSLVSAEPALAGSTVIGGWASAVDAQVDSRALLGALEAAAKAAGVVVLRGPAACVTRAVVDPTGGAFAGVVTAGLGTLRAGHYLVAGGAWSRDLLPALPVHPIKGQMLALTPPPVVAGASPAPRAVLFGDGIYIVPKDGGRRLVVGATVEPDAGFDTSVTAGGVAGLLAAAVALVPGLAGWRLGEVWAGLRPGTPDGLPILGAGGYSNGLDDVLPAFGLERFTGRESRGGRRPPPASRSAAGAAVSPAAVPPPAPATAAVPPPATAPAGGAPRWGAASPVVTTVGTSPAAPPTLRGDIDGAGVVAATGRGRIPPPADKAAADAAAEAAIASGVPLLWHVLPSGERVPVYYKRPPAVMSRSLGDLLDDGVSVDGGGGVPPPPSPSPPPPPPPSLRQPMAAAPPASPTPPARPPVDPETIDATNDAYDDVLANRGPEAEAKQAAAMAASRSFGVITSHVAADGFPSSMSDDEWAAMDSIFAAGTADASEVVRRMDAGAADAGAAATRAEIAAAATPTTPASGTGTGGGGGRSIGGPTQNGVNRWQRVIGMLDGRPF
ncbi:hypothetical protein MMPV_008057 [Pyropia vietnamensis]